MVAGQLFSIFSARLEMDFILEYAVVISWVII